MLLNVILYGTVCVVIGMEQLMRGLGQSGLGGMQVVFASSAVCCYYKNNMI